MLSSTISNQADAVRKVLRYVRLYGLHRTWYKIRARRHMERRVEDLSAVGNGRSSSSRGHVGLIGCGNFPYSTIAYYLRKHGRVMRACMDIDPHRAASLCRDFGLAYFATSARDLISDPEIDLIFVASNHASHTPYAVEALRAGKAVHVEKPHCVTEMQLDDLCDAMRATGGKVSLGFNRPVSPFGEAIRSRLEEQPAPAVLNWFVAGHDLPADHWYFREGEGGRVLGNLCHWTDFLYHMVPAGGRFPIEISPTSASSSDIDIAVTYRFGDDSIAAITFSALGSTFEGIRERFTAQKGDLLVMLDDFQRLTIEEGPKRKTKRLWHRDQGHQARVDRSYAMVAEGAPGESVAYVWETGQLMLQTRRALEENRRVTIEAYPS